MTPTRLVLILTAAALGIAAGPGGASGPQPPDVRPANPHQEENDAQAERILREIAGHEEEPAGQVFRNVRLEWLKSVPAGRFLRIMNAGYSRALGVACTHCHDDADFGSDAKRPKRAAREMAVMHHAINEQLRQMGELEGTPSQRLINCSTCHRGQTTPPR